jgi:thioredoxin 1
MNERVKEVTDDSFEHEVLKSEKPVLVDFWAAWCAPCRMLSPTVEAIAEQYSGSLAVVKLNVDDNPSTAATYGIKGIPTLSCSAAERKLNAWLALPAKSRFHA